MSRARGNFIAFDRIDRAVTESRARGVRMGVRLEVAGFLVDIDPQHRPEEIQVDPLGVLAVVIVRGLVADPGVKVAVGTEMNVTAIVVVIAIPLFDEDVFGGRIHDGNWI